MTTTNAIKSPHQNIDGDQLIDLMVGRIKPKPICVDVNLKQEAMSYEELNKFVFPIFFPSLLPDNTAGRRRWDARQSDNKQ